MSNVNQRLSLASRAQKTSRLAERICFAILEGRAAEDYQIATSLLQYLRRSLNTSRSHLKGPITLAGSQPPKLSFATLAGFCFRSGMIDRRFEACWAAKHR